MIDAIHQLWLSLLKLIEPFIIPDWGQLIALVPYLLVIGVLGPILTLLALAWVIYAFKRPRRRLVFAEGPRVALIVEGEPVYPAGEPYCPKDRLIYPFGATTCDHDKHPLTIRCPKCSTGRDASLDTCGNCGLQMSYAKRELILRPSSPPPGGAAAA